MRARTLALAVAVTAAAAVGPALPLGTAVAAPRGTAAQDDFNGDGYGDVVTATPDAVVDGADRAGSIVVTYGSSSGVTPARSSTVSQGTPGVPGAAEAGDRFGESVASGDLDGDGYADLVVGIPHEAVGATPDVGMVTVLWGGSKGLTNGGTAAQVPEDNAGTFGLDVAVSDLDGDEGQNLAVLSGGRLWTYGDGFNRTTPSRPLDVEGGDLGGDVAARGLVTGDFSASGSSGLVVYGSRDTDEVGGSWLGYFTGGPGGVALSRDLAEDGAPGVASAAVGDLDRDGRADLVTGSPGPSSDAVDDPSHGSGLVTVRYGGPEGPGSGRTTAVVHQDTAGVPGTDESGDGFGAAVSVGDVTGDGYADVAVGVPDETVDAVGRVGSVVLLRGGSRGVTAAGSQSVHQATPGVPGVAETDDRFGSALHVVDVNRNGAADVAIGAVGEDVTPGATEDGAVWLLRGTSGGVTATAAASFSAPAFGLPFTDRRFGSVLGG